MKAKDTKVKPHLLFADMVEKQKDIKAKIGKVTLEEARRLVEWLKDTGEEKRTRDN
ncbi:MAG TPA: hypothetical protein PKD85_08205 [Saprospiraceae bacterium]|nr:hypothetical protein [Saprospiraceae bacterium]